MYFANKVLFRSGYNNATTIVIVITLFLNSEHLDAKKLYKTVSMQNLNFDFKNYFSIQYKLLTLVFCNKKAFVKRKKIKEEITHLIDETGLVYFKKLLPVFENSGK